MSQGVQVTIRGWKRQRTQSVLELQLNSALPAPSSRPSKVRFQASDLQNCKIICVILSHHICSSLAAAVGNQCRQIFSVLEIKVRNLKNINSLRNKKSLQVSIHYLSLKKNCFLTISEKTLLLFIFINLFMSALIQDSWICRSVSTFSLLWCHVSYNL